ncbi:hypothetical protein WI604_30850 [Bradyrhizobium symbiodeficiens]|uniref:hypothetical protein n=1 Tax=Bradyrhizobium symbiodeficiens TaxID=1404367 RepID=UPI0030D06928
MSSTLGNEPLVGRTCQLRELLDFRNEIVHPKDRPTGPSIFVGLEHIERDTGVRIGAERIDLSELTGRRARFQAGDIVYGYLRPYLNKVWIAEFDGICSVDQYVFTVRPGVDRDYVARFLRSDQFLRTAPINAAPGQLPRIRSGEIGATQIVLPDLAEQQRISAILNKADGLRRRRKSAIDLLASYVQSMFLDMFGSPATNPNKYGLKTFGEISKIFSDGPFGSNLKSSHYTETGVRVIRLQNIGVGTFIDEDSAFVSEDHFRSLSKHACLPGDVLIGTLGDPNLRACLHPDWIPVALNKADCVQLRPNRDIALPEYLVALINLPSLEELARGLVRGQTRTRISMGRLRNLPVPIAPIEDQRCFVEKVRAVSKLRKVYDSSGESIQSLFAALEARAFSAEF